MTRRQDAASTPSCRPVGSLAYPVTGPSRCHCGVTVRPVPRGDDWAWADDQGHTHVSHIGEILAELDRCHAVALDKTADMNDPVVAADVHRYSVISAALALGYADTGHSHSPTGPEGRTSTPPPWCCDQPMWAVPAGWRCRVAHTVVPYTDLLGQLVSACPTDQVP